MHGMSTLKDGAGNAVVDYGSLLHPLPSLEVQSQVADVLQLVGSSVASVQKISAVL